MGRGAFHSNHIHLSGGDWSGRRKVSSLSLKRYSPSNWNVPKNYLLRLVFNMLGVFLPLLNQHQNSGDA